MMEGVMPPRGMIKTVPQRKLTDGERKLLSQIFEITLADDDQVIARNDSRLGGPNNSITPGPVPNMAINIWSLDYSRAKAADKWIFIHEMTHVWQWYHGENNI